METKMLMEENIVHWKDGTRIFVIVTSISLV
jgi:hypothetical protein